MALLGRLRRCRAGSSAVEFAIILPVLLLFIVGSIEMAIVLGVNLLLLQCSPQLEEMERFAAEVIPLAGDAPVTRQQSSRPMTPRWGREETPVSSA